MKSVGILGLGAYLPPHVRTNDYWPASTVAAWHERMAAKVTRADAPAPATLTPGMRRTLAAMAELASDPFRGARERRVMADDMTTSEMEARAAREAIERAGVRADEIDAILLQSPIPEHLVVNNSCATHKLLELPERCLAIATNVACNAFAMHVSLAQALIASGQARHVLSVHSSAMARVMRVEEPDSAWWGDGAAAAVLGPVSDGRGVLAAQHHTDGTNGNALVLGVPGKRWWQDGAATYYALDRERTRAMLLGLVDRAGDALQGVLRAAGVAPRDVDFYASHQGAAFYTRATAAQAGLEHAKALVTVPQFGNVNSVNIPLVLAIAEREGMIRDDSTVVTFAGGAGETWSSLCLRWGR